MNSAHSRWPLFAGDLGLARSVIRDLYKNHSISAAQAAHWALNLGDHKAVDRFLLSAQSNPCKNTKAEGIRFRLTREQGMTNPFQAFLRMDSSQQKQVISSANDAWITLNGGIGDHLEDLASLLPWLKQSGNPLRLRCTVTRQQQLKRLLPEALWCSKEVQESEQSITSKVVMAALGDELPRPSSFLDQIPTISSLSQSRLLCCWTAQSKGDHLSGWIRSVPFSVVQNLYLYLVSTGWPATEIVDITNWKPWEVACLNSMGINQIKPDKGDVFDMAQLVNSCKQVVSIDTALVHLCAALGHRVHLLLPLFHDERWHSHLKPGCSYSCACMVHHQHTFNDWDPVIERLSKSLITGRIEHYQESL